MGPKLFLAAVALSIALGVWLHWPAVGSGYHSDDYVQAAMLRGEFVAKRAPWDLFDFASGDRSELNALVDQGYMPWWTAPDLRLRMWRPLASLLMAADHALLGARPFPQHLHSLAWYAVLVIAAALLLRRLFGPELAALASVAFALEEGHGYPSEWIANRSTLIAVAVGFAVIGLHLRQRDAKRDGRGRSFGAPAAGAFVLSFVALCTGEYALTALSYVLVYELVGPPADAGDPWFQRVLAMLPVAVPVVGYLALHSALGHDIVGSGYYLSPIAQPRAFLEAIFIRPPVLMGDLVLGLPSSYFFNGAPWRNEVLSLGWFSPAVWRAIPQWARWQVLIGYLAIGIYIWLARAAIARADAKHAPLWRWLAWGAPLSLLPATGALPGDRLTLAAALGVCALAANTLLHAIASLRGADLPGARRAKPVLLAFSVVWVFGVLSALHVRAHALNYRAENDASRIWALHADWPRQQQADTFVYVLATSDFTTAANLPWIRWLHGEPLTRCYRRLFPAAVPIDVVRTGARSLEITALTAEIYGSTAPSLYRTIEHALRPGYRVSIPGLEVTVLRLLRGNPFSVRFEFDRSLDDPRLWFLQSSARGLIHVHMPAVGGKLRLPAPQLGDLRASLPIPLASYTEWP